MKPTTFQPPQLYGDNGELIQEGAYGQETPFVDDKGTGWSDYVNNNLVYLMASVDAFENDSNGDLMPVAAPKASLRWDTDSNGDIMPV